MTVLSTSSPSNKSDNFHDLFEMGSIGICITSPDKSWIEVNDRVCQILGFTNDEIKKLSWAQLTHPDDLPLDNELFEQVMAGERNSYTLDKRFISKDGSVVYTTMSTTCQRNPDGTVNRFVSSILEITERKRAEEDLREREEKLEMFFSQSLDGFYFMMLDEPVEWNDETDKDKAIGYMMSHERMAKVNDALVEQYQSTREQFLGLTPNDFYAHDLEYGKKIWRESCDCKHLRLVTDERRMDGSQMIIEGDYTCMFDQEKRIIGHFGIQRDITKMKQHEITLRESEEKYKKAFRTNPDSININSIDGIFVEINEGFTALTGYSREDVIGISSTDINLWGIAEDRLKLVGGLNNNGVVENLETVFRCKDGTLKTGIMSATIITINNQPHILSITRDISERKKMENELVVARDKAEEMSRLKSSLLMNMSHELRTPLNGILGFAKILEESQSLPENKYMAGIIYQSGKRLMATLNSIMELAQVEADRMVMNLKTEDIGVITRLELTNHQDLIEKKPIRLITEIDNGIFAKVDANLFKDILFHLLDNAVKFTESGSIHVIVTSEVRSDQKKVVLRVKDTGIGISSEQMDYIFDSFRQGDEGIGRGYEGTGLGLSLCRKLAGLMDGYLEAASQLGKGSVFTLYLPFSDENKEASAVDLQGQIKAPSSESEITGKKLKKPKVLIVEDNEYNCDLTAIYLKNVCLTDQSYNGKSAMSMALQNDYNIILMDINLGHEMDGITAGKEIRKMKNYKEIPIIAVTGYTTYKEREYILSQGFDALLPKPFEKQQLLSVIDQFSPFSN